MFFWTTYVAIGLYIRKGYPKLGTALVIFGGLMAFLGLGTW